MFLAIAIVLVCIPKEDLKTNQENQKSDCSNEDFKLNWTACISIGNETICGKALKILPEPSSDKVLTSQQCLKLCELSNLK